MYSVRKIYETDATDIQPEVRTCGGAEGDRFDDTHHGGGRDAFLAKVSSSGTPQWATYLGVTGYDFGTGIAVDADGNALVTGYAGSYNFALQFNPHHGGDRDAFVAKVSTSGTLQWATYLGGNGHDYGWGIAVDVAGNALVSGWTDSTDFALRNNLYQGGNRHPFVARIDIALPQPGDMKSDGTVNTDDVNPFVQALTNRDAYELQGYGIDADITGDVNYDSAFNLGDLGTFKAFVESLSSSSAGSFSGQLVTASGEPGYAFAVRSENSIPAGIALQDTNRDALAPSPWFALHVMNFAAPLQPVTSRLNRHDTAPWEMRRSHESHDSFFALHDHGEKDLRHEVDNHGLGLWFDRNHKFGMEAERSDVTADYGLFPRDELDINIWDAALGEL